MTLLTYHSGERGYPGFLMYITGGDGVNRGTVIPAYVPVTSSGAEVFPASLGPQTDSGSISVVPSASQNPIFDHANGTKNSVTTSATIITPPAGCEFVRISTDVDIFVNTAGNAAVDDGTSIRIVANSPEIIPVVATTTVKALSSSGSATVRCTPMKVR